MFQAILQIMKVYWYKKHSLNKVQQKQQQSIWIFDCANNQHYASFLMKKRQINYEFIRLQNHFQVNIFMRIGAPHSIKYTVHKQAPNHQILYHIIKITVDNDPFFCKCANLYALNIIPTKHYQDFQWHIHSRSIQLIHQPNLTQSQSNKSFSTDNNPNQILEQIMTNIKNIFDKIIRFNIEGAELDIYNKLIYYMQIQDFSDSSLIGMKILRKKYQELNSGDVLLYCLFRQQKQNNGYQNSCLSVDLKSLFLNQLNEFIYLNADSLYTNILKPHKQYVIKHIIKKKWHQFTSIGLKLGIWIQDINVLNKKIENDEQQQQKYVSACQQFSVTLSSNVQQFNNKQQSQQSSNSLYSQQSSNSLIQVNQSSIQYQNGEELQSLDASQSDIFMKNLPQYTQQERKLVIGFKVIGYKRNFYEFYKKVDEILSQIKLICLKLDQIKGILLNELYQLLPQDKVYMADHETIIIERNAQIQILIQKKLKVGKHLIVAEELPQNLLDIIAKQYQTKRLHNILPNKNLHNKIQIDNDRIIIECTQKQFQDFQQFINNFKKNVEQKIQVQCQLLVNQTDKYTFLKYYQHQITKSYIVEFLQEKKGSKNSNLFFTCLPKDKQSILDNISLIKDQIKTKYISVPTLKPISNFKAQFQNLHKIYRIHKNPKCLKADKLMSTKIKLSDKTNIVITPFVGFSQFQQQLVIFINKDTTKESQVIKILNQQQYFQDKSMAKGVHQRILTKFMGINVGDCPQRIQKVERKDNNICQNFYLVYIDIVDINYRHIEKDIETLLKLNEEKLIRKFLFPSQSKKMIGILFSKLIHKVTSLSKTSEIQLAQLQVHLQDYDRELKYSEMSIHKSGGNFKTLTHKQFTLQALLKIHQLDYWRLYYLYKNPNQNRGQTYQIRGWGAFFFNFQLQRSKRLCVQKKNEKIIITCPNIRNQNIYKIPILINFRQNIAYFFIEGYKIIPVRFIIEMDSSQSIMRYPRKNSYRTSQELLKFLKVFKKFFPHVEFFVTYCQKLHHKFQHKSGYQQIGFNICYNIFYTHKESEVLFNLKYDPDKQKIMKVKGYEIQKYVLKKQIYIQWFSIQACSFAIKDLLACLQE